MGVAALEGRGALGLLALAELKQNEGDLTQAIEVVEQLVFFFRGQAFRRQGFHDAEHEALTRLCARVTGRVDRPPRPGPARAELPRTAEEGMARKDLERILAEHSGSGYEGVRESSPL